ncbi:MAG: hypothetical protein LBS03_00600 [Bacteroidales bacterium]|jgi:hypothetical protein|nr:hypothetical protein [Bacteroidales bacterium]
MKKIIILFAMIWATATLVNAQQLFLGGSLGVEFASYNAKSGGTTLDGPFQLGLTITPKVGFYLNEKLAVGMQAGIGLASVKVAKGHFYPDGTINSGDDYTESSFSWEVTPFVRFNLVEVNKFAFLLEGGLGIYGNSNKFKSGSHTTDKPSIFGFGLEALPILSYNVSERLSIEVSSDILRFAVGRETETDKSTSPKTKGSATYFGLGANTASVLRGSAFTVGAVLKF